MVKKTKKKSAIIQDAKPFKPKDVRNDNKDEVQMTQTLLKQDDKK